MTEPAVLPDLPRAINLGSGKSYDSQLFNIDVNPQWQPDTLVDISQPDALDRVHECGRFGSRKLPRGYFERINAFDVLEHVRELTTLMRHCLDLLAEGGKMFVQVPYDLSLGAWQDPTHVRAFNQNSWLYYTDWYWYLGWDQARFDTESIVYIVSPLGQALQNEGLAVDEIIQRPRAVDAMHVTLRKRRLTGEEAAYTVQMASRKL
jgi:SAM-dependent methyltransferase